VRYEKRTEWQGSQIAGPAVISADKIEAQQLLRLLETGCTAVWRVRKGGLLGVEPSDCPEQREAIQRFHGNDLERTASPTAAPQVTAINK
jgi:hypothetical protein